MLIPTDRRGRVIVEHYDMSGDGTRPTAATYETNLHTIAVHVTRAVHVDPVQLSLFPAWTANTSDPADRVLVDWVAPRSGRLLTCTKNADWGPPLYRHISGARRCRPQA
jgi:hypothetical protein